MFARAEVLQKITESGVIAVLRRPPADVIDRIAESLVAGGITALEVTVDTPGVWEAISRIAQKLGHRAAVGAGTVLDSETAKRAIDSGAQFLFSPSLHRDVIETANRYGKVVMPGVMTPTEIIQAMQWGADLVKLFPAAALGPQYIRDVRAPFPQVPIVPTGGVNLSNVAAFFAAGAAAVGIGGNLVNPQAAGEDDFIRMQELASRYVAAIDQARTALASKAI
ncbi:bifunctional 4-hydroxy-2-oxoglutarate aldolase/2-dehydro-3-deoxy-phosphogluconate aldolase [Brevibacillus humidisoli]|uniref:bifunctional 4-hydroxy-2-oxoglutarate aldolase/2-dehydro-3-deoxy-phosphogluconate aldolase n=1 Tax=Brevibacillus humidisoli TaxID=2895522 RepID=UPI001E63FC84|nr:bifunctional 4-hydroxy-2-oxoglutarate aldolase/2-dehydro-3-deoxy-phosphogluconate aldolase [Brevibacillus humidisoli]UFJ43107.1 bifunctional 4-hydroxy-2-oxoglutarate aldolase/2-dehydro-3-deoxy-phosphogluconate aldolase [Brevibacillus humidisoli]